MRVYEVWPAFGVSPMWLLGDMQLLALLHRRHFSSREFASCLLGAFERPVQSHLNQHREEEASAGALRTWELTERWGKTVKKKLYYFISIQGVDVESAGLQRFGSTPEIKLHGEQRSCVQEKDWRHLYFWQRLHSVNVCDTMLRKSNSSVVGQSDCLCCGNVRPRTVEDNRINVPVIRPFAGALPLW